MHRRSSARRDDPTSREVSFEDAEWSAKSSSVQVRNCHGTATLEKRLLRMHVTPHRRALRLLVHRCNSEQTLPFPFDISPLSMVIVQPSVRSEPRRNEP